MPNTDINTQQRHCMSQCGLIKEWQTQSIEVKLPNKKGRKMLKIDYLNNKEIQRFINWLSRNLDNSTLEHSYQNRKTKTTIKFNSLYDAYAQYSWNFPALPLLDIPSGNSFPESAEALSKLQLALNSAIANGDDSAACDAAIAVMAWGGVTAGNTLWLRNQTQGLVELLSNARDALASGDTSSKTITSNIRFNAGMTKIYSLIVNDFIIYDSRVAAALGWAAVKFCQENGISTLPSELDFFWAPAKESPQQMNPKCRNPSIGGYQFSRLASGLRHAECNLRASWVLDAVTKDQNFKSSQFSKTTLGNHLRSLEAALFMIGYDLPRSEVSLKAMNHQDSHNAQQTTVHYDDVIKYQTLSQKNDFSYRFDENGIQVIDGKHFSIEVIQNVLRWLKVKFHNTPFPLSNSADKVPSGEAEPGVGMAYYEVTNKKGNVPDTSKLVAILKNENILIELKLNKHGMHLIQNSSVIGDDPDFRIFHENRIYDLDNI